MYVDTGLINPICPPASKENEFPRYFKSFQKSKHLNSEINSAKTKVKHVEKYSSFFNIVLFISDYCSSESK